MNLTLQLGRLVRDPEVRVTNAGTSVLSCAIATNRSVPKGNSFVDEVTFVEFTMWGKRAEAFARFHKKGSKAFLKGRLTMETWEDRTTGAKRSKLKMTAEEWEFVSNRPDASAAVSDHEVDDPDVPF